MGNPAITSGDEPTWPEETLEEVLLHSVPLPAMTEQDVRRYGLQCALVALANRGAKVQTALDHLAREFAAAGRENTAKRVRETAKALADKHRPG
jgi:hypothetical protein